jgi:hypothetical protein
VVSILSPGAIQALRMNPARTSTNAPRMPRFRQLREIASIGLIRVVTLSTLGLCVANLCDQCNQPHYLIGSMDTMLRFRQSAPVLRAGYACLALGALTVFATPVVVYWWVGDLSSAPPSNADYVVRPPDWSAATVKAAALGSLSLILLPTGLLMCAVWLRLLRVEWLGVLARLVAAAATVAVGYRVATAGEIGANIGFGFFVMLGVPLCLGLVVWAALISYTLTGR